MGEGSADLDFGDLVVLPGLVDSHVHVNEPGRTDWEGFASATRAARAGGTTTIVDMPLNSIPPTVDPEALVAKRKAAAGTVAVDVAFWGGIVPGSLPQVAALAAEGVAGYKVFMVDSGVPEFPPLDSETLGAAATAVAATGLPLLVHAEDGALLRPPAGDPRSYSTYLATRPPGAESRAIEAAVAVTAPASPRLHVLHVSSGEGVDVLSGAPDRVTAETCPHYLCFDAATIPDGATAFKCAPPIRGREHRERLWEGLLEGSLDMIVSDHSPAPARVKRIEEGDFMAAWGGIASVELRLPAVWGEARRRGIGFERLAGWLATQPARLAGLTAKGCIAPGYDADLVVFDPEGTTEVDAATLQQRHPVTPYDGLRLAGAVRHVFLRGGDNQRGKLLRSGD